MPAGAQKHLLALLVAHNGNRDLEEEEENEGTSASGFISLKERKLHMQFSWSR